MLPLWNYQILERLLKKAVFGVVESVKAASIYMPIAGKVVEVNEVLNDSPEKVNSDPYGDGWMIKIRSNDATAANALLDAESYSKEIQ